MGQPMKIGMAGDPQIEEDFEGRKEIVYEKREKR
jgi:hypothetical protein